MLKEKEIKTQIDRLTSEIHRFKLRFKDFSQRWEECLGLATALKFQDLAVSYSSVVSEVEANFIHLIEDLERLNSNVRKKCQDENIFQSELQEFLLSEKKRITKEIELAFASFASYIKELKELITTKSEKEKKKTTGAEIEVKAGVGGEEASLFVRELFEWYASFFDQTDWKWEVVKISSSPGSAGWKKVRLLVKSPFAFEIFKNEAGVHRIQRVPSTEGSGRVHTSTVTVSVLPLFSRDYERVIIKPADLRIDFFRAGSSGGQHLDKTSSAVRIVHLPTGEVASCQEERNQHTNKARALKRLTEKLVEIEREKSRNLARDLKRVQSQAARRSQKIRTYDFPADQVTEHKSGKKIGNLKQIFSKGGFKKFLSYLLKS